MQTEQLEVNEPPAPRMARGGARTPERKGSSSFLRGRPRSPKSGIADRSASGRLLSETPTSGAAAGSAPDKALAPPADAGEGVDAIIAPAAVIADEGVRCDTEGEEVEEGEEEQEYFDEFEYPPDPIPPQPSLNETIKKFEDQKRLQTRKESKLLMCALPFQVVDTPWPVLRSTWPQWRCEEVRTQGSPQRKQSPHQPASTAKRPPQQRPAAAAAAVRSATPPPAQADVPVRNGSVKDRIAMWETGATSGVPSKQKTSR